MSTIRDWNENPAVNEVDETVAALREALSDMKNGDAGQVLEEFDREFQKRHSI